MDFPLPPAVCALFELKVESLYFCLIWLSYWMFSIQLSDLEHVFAAIDDNNSDKTRNTDPPILSLYLPWWLFSATFSPRLTILSFILHSQQKLYLPVKWWDTCFKTPQHNRVGAVQVIRLAWKVLIVIALLISLVLLLSLCINYYSYAIEC